MVLHPRVCSPRVYWGSDPLVLWISVKFFGGKISNPLNIFGVVLNLSVFIKHYITTIFSLYFIWYLCFHLSHWWLFTVHDGYPITETESHLGYLNFDIYCLLFYTFVYGFSSILTIIYIMFNNSDDFLTITLFHR